MLETLVHKIKHNLCLVNFVSLDEPQVISSVESCDVCIALALLFAGANVGHCFEAMSGEDLGINCIRSVVHNAEKRVEVCLFVAILNPSQLVVDTRAIVASRIHGKEHYDVVRPWIFDDQLPIRVSLRFQLTYRVQR